MDWTIEEYLAFEQHLLEQMDQDAEYENAYSDLTE
jgi:hypothetical protein